LEDLRLIPIVVTLHGTPDARWSELICVRLASHADPVVRGNAVLGLGHLARTAGTLDRATCTAVVSAALLDSVPYVRGQAHAAADDLRHFLGWSVELPDEAG
jgi:hypothetical protein